MNLQFQEKWGTRYHFKNHHYLISNGSDPTRIFQRGLDNFSEGFRSAE